MKKVKDTLAFIFKPLSDLYHMFFTNDKGMSLRKGGFVFGLICAYRLQTSIVDDHVKQGVISSWQIFAAVCIGLVTIPELIKFLNRDNNALASGATVEVPGAVGATGATGGSGISNIGND